MRAKTQGLPPLLLLLASVAVCVADVAPPPNHVDTLAPIARSKSSELRFVEPESLDLIWRDSVRIGLHVSANAGELVLFVDQEMVARHNVDGRTHEFHHEAKGLAHGLHRAYAVLLQQTGERLQASVQFYIVLEKDPIDYYRKACVNNVMFSLGINSPCDGIFQSGHELRLAKKLDQALPLLVDATQHNRNAIVYPYLELAILLDELGDRKSAVRARQIVERIQPGYIPATHPTSAWPSSHPRAITVDLKTVEEEDLSPWAHLMCLWSGMIITRHAGIRAGVGSAGRPGNHYRLLRRIATQFENALIVELGTLHGAATIALAGNGKNKVVSFNVLDDVGKNVQRCNMSQEEFERAIPGQVQFIIADATQDDHLDLLAQADLIFIDTNHLGDIEDIVYQYLSGIKWQGIMILDDIFLNDPMDGWWGSVRHPKYDVTDWGHTASGTGIIDFANRINFHL